MKRHWEDMRKMREGMEANHEKRMRKAFERTRSEILNNGSAGSMPSLKSESFDDKKTTMTGIDCEDKYREEEKMRRAMREEVAKSVRDEFCATLQHRSEAMRKDNGRMTRKAL